DLTAALVEQFSSDSPGNSQPDHKDSTLTASQTNQHTDFNTITSQCNQHTDITVTTITSQPTQHTDFNTTASQPTQHTDFHMLGCDIDNILIQRATENHRHTDHLTFQTLDYMDTEQRQESLGSYLQRFSRTKFDVTFCFSVTMWIHLQNGDSGLRDFLRSVSSNTWFLLLEPQPWKCYRSAARRLRKLGRAEFPQLQELQIRSNVETEIDRCLTQDCAMRRAGGFGETQWGRKLVLYYSGEGELL
ncbi:PREDICTED: pre-miRNA 5'-monophosphate methyltransferase-like, partial [Branchiostoma belcheri]|uniref:RNA methyltransferase n=1 Tax=Branchiostoma belcheri TaxID=7741 RepID=A0A6P4Y7G2_BRABE